MKRLSSRLSLLVTVALAGATFASAQDYSTLSQLANYHHWTRINSEPVKVDTQVGVQALVSPDMSTAI